MVVLPTKLRPFEQFQLIFRRQHSLYGFDILLLLEAREDV